MFQLVAARSQPCQLWTTGCAWVLHFHARWDPWEGGEGSAWAR